MGRPSSLASASNSSLPPALSAKLADLFRTSFKSCAADFASANPYPYFDHHHRSLQHAHPSLANPDAWNFDALLNGLLSQSDSSPSRIHFDRWVRSIILASATLGPVGGTPSRPPTSRPPLPTESPDSFFQPLLQGDTHHRSASSRWEPADRRALDRPLPPSHAPAHVHAHDWLSSHSLLRARHDGLPRVWGRESPVWNWTSAGDSVRVLPRARPANTPTATLPPPADDPASAARLNLTLPSFSSILSSSLPPSLSPAPAPAAAPQQPLSELENDMRELQDVTLRIVHEGILRELSHPDSSSEDPSPVAGNSDDNQAADQQIDFPDYISTSMSLHELRRIRNQIARRADGLAGNASPTWSSGADERDSVLGQQHTERTADTPQPAAAEQDTFEHSFETAPPLAFSDEADAVERPSEPASAPVSMSSSDVSTPTGARNRTADFASHSALVRSSQRRAFAASQVPSGPETDDESEEDGDCGRRRRRPCCAPSASGSSEAAPSTSRVPTTADLAESFARATNAHGALPAFYMADPSRPIDILEVLIPVDTDPMERRKMIRHATRDGGNVVRWNDAAQKAMFEAAEDGLVGEEIGLIKISCVCLPDREPRERPSIAVERPWITASADSSSERSRQTSSERSRQADSLMEVIRRNRGSAEMIHRNPTSSAASYRPYPRSDAS